MIELTGWRPYKKNTLYGFVSIRLGSGLKINGCTVHRAGNGSAWIGLPGAPQLDQDGQAKRDINGKVLWVPVVEWRDREQNETFSRLAIEELLRCWPDAFE